MSSVFPSGWEISIWRTRIRNQIWRITSVLIFPIYFPNKTNKSTPRYSFSRRNNKRKFLKLNEIKRIKLNRLTNKELRESVTRRMINIYKSIISSSEYNERDLLRDGRFWEDSHRFIRYRVVRAICGCIWSWCGIYGGEKLAARLKVRERGRTVAVKHGITHPLHAPSFLRGGDATSYFSRHERMEIEAEMNATVTVVPRISTDVVCISHKRDRVFSFFFFSSRNRTYAFLFFFLFFLSAPPTRVGGSRKGKAEKRREGDKREKDIYANVLGVRVPKSVSNVVIRKAIRLEARKLRIKAACERLH